jgi:hypothetical protein
MGLLAAVGADGTTPLVEALVQGLPRLRRGMTAVVVTPSLERTWVRPLAALRGRGIRCTVCLLDRAAYDAHALASAGQPPRAPEVLEDQRRAERAMLHALAEYDIVAHRIVPERALGELLVTTTPGGLAVVR